MGQGFVNFKDLPDAAKEQPKAAESSLLEAAGDVVTGAGKGVANTVIGLGQLVNEYVPGVQRLNQAIYGQPVTRDTFGAARQEFATPTNTAQKVGFGAEQIGEFFLPVGAVGKIGKAAEVGKSGVLTLAQGGSPVSAGISAGITAAIPAAGGAARLSRGLKQGAEKEMARGLGATKEVMKDEAAALAPGMFTRGVKGSRQAMLDQAKSKLATIGPKIGAEIKAAANAGQTVSGLVIRGELQLAKDGLMVANAAGKNVPIAGAEAVLGKLDRLDKFVGTLGDDIPFDKAQKIKSVWDRIVSKSGLYNQKAGAAATDNASAWALREGAGSFRDLLASGSPTLADLNKEYAFWAGMRKVLRETERRTQAQSGGLVSAGMGGAGAVIGGFSGDSTSDRVQNAVIGGLAGRKLIQVIQSPAWRTTVTGPMKHKLAEALATGNGERITHAIGRIAAAAPSQALPR